MPHGIFFGTSGTSNKHPSPVALQVVIPAPTIFAEGNLNPSPVQIPINLTTPNVFQGQFVFPTPRTLPLSIPAPTLTLTKTLSPTPVALPVVIPALTGGAGGGGIRQYHTLSAGDSGLEIVQPDFSAVPGLAGMLKVLSWETHRYINQVGDWKAVVPINDQLIDGEPLQRQLKRGWRVSIIQENNNPRFLLTPLYLLYQGVLENTRYNVLESGTARLELAGSFRSLTLAHRLTHQGLEYNGTFQEMAEGLVDGENIIGVPGGIILPPEAGSIALHTTFDDKTRLGALLQGGQLARMTWRESWDHDRPEFVKIDGAPFSGITLVAVEEAGDFSEAASIGIGIIGDLPEVGYDGSGIANRIIALGSDFADGDFLTLGDVDDLILRQPYIIQTGINPDGSFFYYVEDVTSQEEHSRVDARIIRTDIKNPSDTDITREQAAEVLYALAVGELMKRRGEWEFVRVPVANGPQIWALPGSTMRLQYTGRVRDANGQITWLEVDRFYLITERHDFSDPSGVRRVEFVLAAPTLEYTLPGLPEPIEEDDETPTVTPPPPPPPTPPPVPPGPDTPPAVEPCCPDPESETNDGGAPPPPVNEGVGIHETATIWRSTPFNFTAGGGHLPGFQGTYLDMDATPFWVKTHQAGDHLIRYWYWVQNHSILGLDGAEYNVVTGTGSHTQTRHIGPFNKGVTLGVFGSFMARGLGAGDLIGVDFQAIVGSTIRLSPFGTGEGFVDNGYGGLVMHPENSWIEITRMTNVPLTLEEL